MLTVMVPSPPWACQDVTNSVLVPYPPWADLQDHCLDSFHISPKDPLPWNSFCSCFLCTLCALTMCLLILRCSLGMVCFVLVEFLLSNWLHRVDGGHPSCLDFDPKLWMCSLFFKIKFCFCCLCSSCPYKSSYPTGRAMAVTPCSAVTLEQYCCLYVRLLRDGCCAANAHTGSPCPNLSLISSFKTTQNNRCNKLVLVIRGGVGGGIVDQHWVLGVQNESRNKQRGSVAGMVLQYSLHVLQFFPSEREEAWKKKGRGEE